MLKPTREVKKVKVLQEEVNVEYVSAIQVKDKVFEDNDSKNSKERRPNENFQNAMDNLRAHIALIFGYSKAESPEDVEPEILMKIRAQGIARKGEGEAEGVTVSGMVKVLNKHWVSVSTHFIRFSDEETYAHAGELYAKVNSVAREAIKWIDGEHAPNPQQELDLEEPKKAPHKRKKPQKAAN